MRVVVLVLDPDLGLALVADIVPDNPIDVGTKKADHLRAQPGRHAPIPIVEANDYKSAGLGLARDRGEGGGRVLGVVQHASGNDYVKTFVFDPEIKNIHLDEAHARYPVAPLVLDGKLQARQRQIDAEHIIVVEREEVGELARAAAAFQHQLVKADGFEEVVGEHRLLTAVYEIAELLDTVVIGKRVLFVEALDFGGDADREGVP